MAPHRLAVHAAQREREPVLPPADVDGAEMCRAVDGTEAVRSRLAVGHKCLVDPARGDLEKRVGDAGGLAIDGADMAVAGEEHHTARLAVADEIEQALALARQIAPALP